MIAKGFKYYSLRSTPPDNMYNLKIMKDVNYYNFVKKLEFILIDDLVRNMIVLQYK